MSFLELLFFNIIRCGDGINNRVFNTMCPKNIVDEIKKLKLWVFQTSVLINKMFINFWSKYSKQQCHLHYKKMKGMFESCCGEFLHCAVCWQLFWKFLEVSDFPMQLSLNSVVLNMCSHFLNVTKLGENKNPWTPNLWFLSSAEFSLKEKKKHFSLFRKFTRKSQVFLKIYFKRNYITKLKLTRIPALPPLPNSKHHHFLFTEIFSKKKKLCQIFIFFQKKTSKSRKKSKNLSCFYTQFKQASK